MLAYFGFETLTAKNVASGLQMALDYQPDIMMVDLMLQKKDGWTLIKKIRNQVDLADCTIIAMSASAVPEESARSIQLGADALLVKPIQSKKLLATIEECFPLQWADDE
jgi:DNA-binding response OmpR family regulator